MGAAGKLRQTQKGMCSADTSFESLQVTWRARNAGTMYPKRNAMPETRSKKIQGSGGGGGWGESRGKEKTGTLAMEMEMSV